MIVILVDREPWLSPDVWTESVTPPRLRRHSACPRHSISGWRSADLTPAGSSHLWCHFFIFSCSLHSPQWWWSADRELWRTFLIWRGKHLLNESNSLTTAFKILYHSSQLPSVLFMKPKETGSLFSGGWFHIWRWQLECVFVFMIKQWLIGISGP